jgi:lipopolysaccharide transport system ATP-binding protein
MGDVAKEGRTVLFVSHNMGAVMALCTQGIHLEHGRLAFAGTTQDALDHYLRNTGKNMQQTAGHLAWSEELGVGLSKVELIDRRGETVPYVLAGETAAIRLHLTSNSAVGDLFVSISVNTFDERRICVFHSRISGYETTMKPPGKILDCAIAKVPFLAETYSLNIKVEVGGHHAFYVTRAAELPVEAGSFYSTGKMPERSWAGAVMVDCDWRAWDVDDDGH